jgi:predicted PurR-regulated permease PerM
MKRRPTLEQQEHERKIRRRVFKSCFWILTACAVVLLIWKLSSLLLPMLVGAFMAYLFRPLKDRFQIPWLHHELRVLTLFACVGFALFLVASTVRRHIPDEKQKLELKVRIKYKMNEKFQELTGANDKEKRGGAVATLVMKELGPMVDKVNAYIDLTPEEQELFLKYREGYNGQAKIEDRFFDYFQANQTTSVYAVQAREPSEAKPESHAASSGGPALEAGHHGMMEDLSIWIIAPLIFIFLGFDNGQIRRYVIGLVPNRYFELSLTVMDELDDAIGRYLRGTLMECALVGATLAFGFILVGLPVSIAIAIGVVSGLVNAIPFLGTVIGLIIGLAYALVAENVQPLIPGLNPNDLTVYVCILVFIAHMLDNAIYAPIVLGKAVNLHPLVVALAILSGSLLGGAWGMLFAIPTVVVVKTAVETLFKELKDYRII